MPCICARLAAALFLAAALGFLGHPAGAVELGGGTKNFTPPPGVPNYFSNEAEPFNGAHTSARLRAPSRVSPVPAPPHSYAAAPREREAVPHERGALLRRVVFRHVVVRRVVHGRVVLRHVVERRVVVHRAVVHHAVRHHAVAHRVAGRHAIAHRAAVRPAVLRHDQRRSVHVTHAAVRREAAVRPAHPAARREEVRHRPVRSGQRS